MKQEYYLYTFESTHAAIKADKLLRPAGSVVMPVPRFLSSSCGISVRISPEKRDEAEAIVREQSDLRPYVDDCTEFDYRYWHISTDSDNGSREIEELPADQSKITG